MRKSSPPVALVGGREGEGERGGERHREGGRKRRDRQISKRDRGCCDQQLKHMQNQNEKE